MSDTVTSVAPATTTAPVAPAPAVPPHLEGLTPIVHAIPPAPVLTHPDFTPIKGPANPSQGPSTGDSTENGDNWHIAVHKINAMFKALFGKIEVPANGVVTTVGTDARTAITDLENQIAALQKKHDDLVNAHAATAATVAAMNTPAEPPPPPEATGIMAKTS
jgi:hypothetical protein